MSGVRFQAIALEPLEIMFVSRKVCYTGMLYSSLS